MNSTNTYIGLCCEDYSFKFRSGAHSVNKEVESAKYNVVFESVVHVMCCGSVQCV